MKDNNCNNSIWDLSSLMANDESFFRAIGELDKEIDVLKGFEGKLNSKETIVTFFKEQKRVGEKIEKPYLYAFLKYSGNMADANNTKLMQTAENFAVKFSSALSFVEPELTALGKEFLEKLKDDPTLQDYNRIFETVIRHIPHTLAKNEEKLIAEMGAFTDFENTFSLLSDTEINFGSVKNEEGKLVKLDNSSYGLLLRSPSSSVRLEAHKKLHKGYKNFNKTLSANYINEVKKCDFLAKTYHYKDYFEMSLYSEEVDSAVYKNLIDGVNKFLPLFYDYVEVKKKSLKLKEFNIADCYAPINETKGFDLPYDNAFEKVVEVLGVLGDDYVDVLKYAKTHGWIDVYPKKGKRSGAFSVTTENANPYVMLNYLPTYRDISTIAHELGHSMHTYFTNHKQCYEKRRYETFVAEIASTVNEQLLFRYYLKNAKDDNQKKFLIESFLSDFYATVFRQTMFAEFQLNVNNLVSAGNAISSDDLNNLYQKLLEKYFGNGVNIHEYCKYEWSRIPHFYNSFYVYTYATGLISAIAIVNNIEKNGAVAVKEYKEFLSGGCSLAPTKLLQIAGVDIEKPETIENAFAFYKEKLEQLKSIL